jgi:hypothetical protein
MARSLDVVDLFEDDGLDEKAMSVETIARLTSIQWQTAAD